MYTYKIEFSGYILREYEKYLAIKEFEGQFPLIKKKVVSSSDIKFKSPIILDEEKIKNLTFFSEYQFQNSNSSKTNGFTNQAFVENYRSYNTDLFQHLKLKRIREIRYLTHSFHEYKGRFYPQLAKSFINYAGIKKGETILDPFCGSGTTLVESLLFGVNAIGIDINPIACLLAEAKVRSLLLTRMELDEIIDSFTT